MNQSSGQMLNPKIFQSVEIFWLVDVAQSVFWGCMTGEMEFDPQHGWEGRGVRSIPLNIFIYFNNFFLNYWYNVLGFYGIFVID